MGIINILDFSVANLIAAGEVVDRPASAVKEMLENALDAGSTSVTVEIKNGGSSFMRVSDNGCGMEKDDVPLCIKRHATSKIHNAADLDNILTLGFRGEALAAIASVSKLRIMTKPHGAEMGTLFACENGNVTAFEPAGCPEGTTVIVEELFANVPARRKFLKKDVSETTAVVAVVEKIALSHPDAVIKLITDGTVRFTTAGDGKLYNTIYAVLGRDFAKKLTEVRDMTEGIEVNGYVGRPDNVRGNRNYQNFFINGRYVKSATAVAALEQAFVSYCPVERFPVCVLNIIIHPALVDVNVHPAKLEVKFSNEKIVFNAVYCAVRNALQQHISRPTPDLPHIKASGDDLKGLGDLIALKLETAEAAAKMSLDREKLNVTYEQLSADLREKEPESSAAEGRRRIRVELPAGESIPLSVPSTAAAVSEPVRIISAPEKLTGSAEVSPSMTAATASPESSAEPFSPSTSVSRRLALPWYRICGVFFNCYVVVELDKKVLLIDKHAAHERILFEQLKSNLYRTASAPQLLLLPIPVTLGSGEFAAVSDFSDELHRIGYDFTVTENDTTVELLQIPSELDRAGAAVLFTELCGKLTEGTATPDITRATALEKALFQASCKAAVKGGREDSGDTVRWITEEVLTNPDIKFCPHGRPVAFEMTEQQVEHLFRRS